jgi:hypothetical protein
MIKRLNNKGFSHVELFLLVLVIVLVSGVGYFVYNRNKSAHAGSQVVANITTKHAGNFSIIACRQNVKGSTTNFTISSTANYADPAHVQYGYDGTVTSYYAENGASVFGVKDSSKGENWVNNTVSPNLVFDVDETQNSSITFGISTTNVFAKPIIENELATTSVNISGIPLCSSGVADIGGSKTVLYLLNGEKLNSNDKIISQNSKYALLQEAGGDVVSFNSSATAYVWQSHTGGNPNAYTVLQSDGNLVTYSSVGKVLWQSGTSGNPGDILTVDNAGYPLIISKNGVPIFTTAPKPPITSAPTSISGSSKEYVANQTLIQTSVGSWKLVMTANGNLEEYNSSGYVPWSSGTNHPGAIAVFQTDGNLVVYSSAVNGSPLWSTNTSGNKGAKLSMNSQGVFNVFSSNGSILWPKSTVAITSPVSIARGAPAPPAPTPAPQLSPTAPSVDNELKECRVWYKQTSGSKTFWYNDYYGEVDLSQCRLYYNGEPNSGSKITYLYIPSNAYKNHFQWNGINYN